MTGGPAVQETACRGSRRAVCGLLDHPLPVSVLHAAAAVVKHDVPKWPAVGGDRCLGLPNECNISERHII